MLSHALFVLHFLTLDDDGKSAADGHWSNKTRDEPMAYWRDPMDGKTYGPDPVLMWGRGYVCVFPTDETSPRWIPERDVRHAGNQGGKTAEEDAETDCNPDLGKKDARENTTRGPNPQDLVDLTSRM